MAHGGGAGRQEPSILWIGRVLRNELITLPAPSPTLDNRIRLQIPLNLLSRNMSLPCQKRQGRRLPEIHGADFGCEEVPKWILLTLCTLYWLY